MTCSLCPLLGLAQRGGLIVSPPWVLRCYSPPWLQPRLGDLPGSGIIWVQSGRARGGTRARGAQGMAVSNQREVCVSCIALPCGSAARGSSEVTPLSLIQRPRPHLPRVCGRHKAPQYLRDQHTARRGNHHVLVLVFIVSIADTSYCERSSGFHALLSLNGRRGPLGPSSAPCLPAPLAPHAISRHCSSSNWWTCRLTIATEDCGCRWNRSQASRPSHSVCPGAYSTRGYSGESNIPSRIVSERS